MKVETCITMYRAGGDAWRPLILHLWCRSVLILLLLYQQVAHAYPCIINLWIGSIVWLCLSDIYGILMRDVLFCPAFRPIYSPDKEYGIQFISDSTSMELIRNGMCRWSDKTCLTLNGNMLSYPDSQNVTYLLC